MDTRIYVMTHKKIAEIPDEMYIPLHVGKAGKEDYGYLGDDTGDNISEKNANYCELTGIYWLWKNIKCDIVGVCHYRRFMVSDEMILRKEEIEEYLQKYDIIIPSSCRVEEEDIYAQYCKKHKGKDLDLCREVIREKYPEYVFAFDYIMRTSIMSIGNMWITRKAVFDSYCEWLFDILFEVEKRIDMTGYDTYQKRVMGFLSERLFRVWLLMQSVKIKEVKIKEIEVCDFFNAEKEIELVNRCVKLKLAPVLQMYQSGNGGALIKPFVCEDNFEGKIPVWICWWQGESNMSELVKCCIESLKKNLPLEKVVLRMITLQNCMEYVTFTERIIQSFNEGKISMTHMSDILRAELLYRYGGMWIDVTYYVANKIPESIFEKKELYTLKFKNVMWKADIAKGRWSRSFLYVGQLYYKLFQFLTESFWYYWEVEDECLNYDFFDYVFAIAVEEFQEIKVELDKCPYSTTDVYELQKYIDKKCTPERMKKLKTESVFYKLNRRMDYYKENIVGQQTVYGYLIAEELKNKYK